MPSEFKKNVNGRIEYLQGESLLHEADSLHLLRRRRNEIAHVPDSARLDWNELKSAVDTAEAELQHLNIVSIRPKYEFYGEKSQARESEVPNVIFSFDYSAGIKLNGDWVYRIGWIENIHKSTSE